LISSITFNTESELTTLEVDAFYSPSLSSVVVPQNSSLVTGGAFPRKCVVRYGRHRCRIQRKAERRRVRLKRWIVVSSQRKKINSRTTFLMRLWVRRDKMGKWVNGIVYMIKQWKNNYIMWKSGIWLLYAPNGNPFRVPISQNHPMA
jgi:hypothetical protein